MRDRVEASLGSVSVRLRAGLSNGASSARHSFHANTQGALQLVQLGALLPGERA